MHLDFDLNECYPYKIENIKLVPDSNENPEQLRNATACLQVTNPAKSFSEAYKSRLFATIPDKATVEVVNACNYLSNIFTSKSPTDEEASTEATENICTLFAKLCLAYIDLARLYDENYGYPDDDYDEE